MPDPQGLTLTPEEVRQWWSRVDLSRKKRKEEADRWKRLREGYLPPRSADADSINSNIHFRDVELKKSEVFAQLPDLDLQPLAPIEGLIDPTTQQPIDAYAATAALRDLLNKLLGRDYANVIRAIDLAHFDVFATSGIGATMICYHADLQQTPQETPGPEQTMPGAILGLQTVPGPTQTQMVPVAVHEAWEWEHFSSAALLIPHDWRSNLYDKAPWLGREFCYPLAKAIREFNLPPDFQGNASRDDLSLDGQAESTAQGGTSFVKGVLIWLRACEFDPSVAHSQKFRELVLIEAQPKEARYRDSQYQTFDQTGRLSADSVVGNPIHPLVLRDLTDAAYVPSDSAFTDPLVKQENTWRAQDIKLRDANVPRFLHAESVTEAVEKLKNADVGQGAGVPDASLAMGIDKLIVALPKLERAESDVQGAAAIRRDREETLGVGANQAGGMNPTVRSATEVATVQSNVTKRLRKERSRSIEWYLIGVASKFTPLVLRYGDLNNLTPIVGAQHAQLILAWKAVGGRNGFDAKPDSQLSVDTAEDRELFLKYQNFNAKNPCIDQLELSRIGALKFGYDPSRLVKEPQAPGPPPPNVSIRITIADFAGPASNVAFKIAQQAGYQLTQEDMAIVAANAAIVAAREQATQAASTEHGGAANEAEKLSKHHGEQTGAMPGQVPQGAPPAQTPGMVQ